MSRSIGALLITCSLLVSTVSLAQFGGNPRTALNTIHVQVRMPGGRMAPQGIMVLLEDQDSGNVAQNQTDITGKVTFTPAAQGIYVVIVRQVGFEEARGIADLKTGPSAFVTLELKPKPQRDVSVPPSGILPANIAPNALKEFEEGQRLLMKEQKVDESIPHFKKAIDHDKNFAGAYTLLGYAYLVQHKPGDAQPVLEKAVKLDANAALPHLELGAMYNMQKRFKDAERELQTGLKLNDRVAEGHYELAKAYWAMQQWDAAEPELVTTVRLQPDLAPAHILLGDLRLRKNDGNGAKREYEEYLRLQPNGPMATAAKDMLSKLADAGVK
jgi:tetratricopeptide (TPR) repeat protein